MPNWATCGDAAFADNLRGTNFDAVAGYLDAPNATHPWSKNDWALAPGPKLPIWVANFGQKNGRNDAEKALAQLDALGVKEHKTHYVALDMEMSKDKTYCTAFGTILQHHGFRVLVYGSASTVFINPQLNGYWVAEYIFTPFMHSHPGTRMTQWTDGDKYDQSTVKPWILEYWWR